MHHNGVMKRVEELNNIGNIVPGKLYDIVDSDRIDMYSEKVCLA